MEKILTQLSLRCVMQPDSRMFRVIEVLHRVKVFQEKCMTLILLFTLEQALQIRKIHITRNTSLSYYATLYQQTCEMSYVFTLKDLYKPTHPLC